MSAMASLASRTAEGLSTCIIDARLALAPGGLALASGMGRVNRACLTRRFWSMVDGAYFYHSYPDELLAGYGEDGATVLETLMLWHAAWLNGALDGVFCWIGDARRESALPMDWNCDVIARYERLAAAFPASDGEESIAAPLTACGQEAFALAAALTVDAPVILTRANEDDSQPPSICLEAAETARLRIHGPAEWQPHPIWAERLIPMRIRPLIDQLECLGTRISAVHTLAPGAMSLTPASPIDEAGDQARGDRAPDRQPWGDAHVFWHPLS